MLPRAASMPRHFAEQETLDDFAETMGRLKKDAKMLKLLEARIEGELEKARDSVRPPKEKPDEPVRSDP